MRVSSYHTQCIMYITERNGIIIAVILISQRDSHDLLRLSDNFEFTLSGATKIAFVREIQIRDQGR